MYRVNASWRSPNLTSDRNFQWPTLTDVGAPQAAATEVKGKRAFAQDPNRQSDYNLDATYGGCC